MTDDLRERVANLLDSDGFTPPIGQADAMTEFRRKLAFEGADAILAEIQRTHAIVPHKADESLNAFVCQILMSMNRRVPTDAEILVVSEKITAALSRIVPASPPQPPTRAGGDEPAPIARG